MGKHHLTKILRPSVLLNVLLSGILLLVFFIPTAWADCGGVFATAVTKSFKVESFHSLELSGEANLILRQGEKESLSIKAPAQVIEDLEIGIRSGRLKIEPDKCDREYDVILTMKEIKSLEFSGSVTVGTPERIEAKDLKIATSGSSELQLIVTADNLELSDAGSSEWVASIKTQTIRIETSGSSELEFSGIADSLSISSSGSISLDAINLVAKDVTVSTSGSNTLKLNVTNSLEVDTSGSAEIEYAGQPKVSVSASGGFEIKSLK